MIFCWFAGDDGSGDEPQQGILVKESESHYSLWSSGRVNCEGLLIELKVSQRHGQRIRVRLHQHGIHALLLKPKFAHLF